MDLEYVPERDLYELLAVRPDANADEIKRAHRRLIDLCHPDVGGGEDRANALNYARDVLVDGVQRRKYDQLRAGYLATHQPGRSSLTAECRPPGHIPQRSRSITEMCADDVRNVISSIVGGAYAIALVGTLLEAAIGGPAARGPVARSAVDVLTKQMRDRRVNRTASTHTPARRARVRTGRRRRRRGR